MSTKELQEPKTRWVVKREGGESGLAKEVIFAKEISFYTEEEAKWFSSRYGYPPPIEYVEVVK